VLCCPVVDAAKPWYGGGYLHVGELEREQALERRVALCVVLPGRRCC
jgi:hypothetical protein